jgi:hypothetical protein
MRYILISPHRHVYLLGLTVSLTIIRFDIAFSDHVVIPTAKALSQHKRSEIILPNKPINEIHVDYKKA